MSSKVEELEAKLQAKRAERAKAEEAQYEIDLQARLDLEEEHENLSSVQVPRFTPGQPTRAYVRTPNAAEYKRYKDLTYKAVRDPKATTSIQGAQEQLARACWVYPGTKEAQDSMLAAFPGLLTPLSSQAVALAEGKGEDEGKD